MKHIRSWIQMYKLQGIMSWLLLLLAASCSDSEKELEEPVPPEPVAASITLSEGTDKQPLVESAGGTFSINFTATAAWTASIGNSRADSWISVSPASGEAGEKSVTITVASNESTDERSASVFLTCGEEQETIVVTQKQKDALILSQQVYELPDVESVIELEVQANVSYETSISVDWIEPVTSRSLTKETLTFRVAANESTEQRSGTITVKSGELEETVNVYQAGKAEEPVLLLSDEVLNVGAEGGTVDVQVQSNVAYTYRAEAEYDWIAEPASRAVSTHTIHLEVQPNETYDSREARFIFTDETATLTDTLVVRQAAAGGLIVSASRVDLAAEDTGFSLELQTNVDYTVSIDADWLEQVTSRGLKTETLTFSCGQNYSTASREAVIRLDSEIGEQEVKVVQAGRIEDVGDHDFMNVSPPSLSLASDAASFTISVSTNVDYQVASNVDWITATVSGTTNASSVTFDVKANEGATAREGIITFTSSDGSMVRTVTVTQAGKEIPQLDISPAMFTLTSEEASIEVAVEANVKYTVSSSAVWLVSPVSGLTESNSLTFDVAANEETSVREATLTFTSEDGSITRTVTVTQAGKEAVSLNVSPASFDLSNEATSVNVSIETNTKYTVSSSAVWLVSPVSGLTESNSLTFDVAANEETSVREATLTFTSEDGSITRTVTVTQAGKEAVSLSVSPTSFNLSNEATSVNVSIETNTKYTVSSSAVWLVSPVSGLTESNSLAFDVAANEETSVREATLTFTSEDGSITRTVTVTQAGKELYLNVTPLRIDASAEGGTYPLTISTNAGEPNVNLNGNAWMSLQNGNIVIAANADRAERKGNITVTAGELSRTIEVVQAGKQPSTAGGQIEDFTENEENW
ncbi:BACON domain-containing carbohydrate-binding protein [Bacteroides gallinaceum]|uniref:BACON domain-containing protein n=2 Tax=Bacteroides TaxID=816 RepID=UPI0025AB2177|nr:BACON domain-containing carbohydrate-binding protein [Bacteroides gallinaceum]MDN0079267.1 BACON domain-containing carbohydrate-binding protein [Bacteroides gallinaceum]